MEVRFLLMAQPATPRDPVSVVIPVHNAAERLEKVVPAWADFLARLGRTTEARVAYEEAALLTENDAEREFLVRALDRLKAPGLG